MPARIAGMNPRPIFLFTDFGFAGPYVGQMTAAILTVEPRCPVVSLMHDAPSMRPELAAYLLPACCQSLPPGAVVVAVVDPGVGGARAALVVESGGVSYVGPDNGLLSRLPAIAGVQRVDWRPPRLSASFHGRDLFAPVAARVAAGQPVAMTALAPAAMHGADWADELAHVVYIDHYGNCMTGLRAENVNQNSSFHLAGRVIRYAETFCRVSPGEPFWYANSQGLVEVAVNAGSAATLLSLALGDETLLD
jgi:S-adenosylmethionine hydrolase